jgi:hypothetical protein
MDVPGYIAHSAHMHHTLAHCASLQYTYTPYICIIHCALCSYVYTHYAACNTCSLCHSRSPLDAHWRICHPRRIATRVTWGCGLLVVGACLLLRILCIYVSTDTRSDIHGDGTCIDPPIHPKPKPGTGALGHQNSSVLFSTPVPGSPAIPNVAVL